MYVAKEATQSSRIEGTQANMGLLSRNTAYQTTNAFISSVSIIPPLSLPAPGLPALK